MFLERLIKTLSILIVLFLLACGLFLSFNIFFWEDVYEEIPIQQKKITIINADSGAKKEIIYQKQELKGKPFTFLLLGVDTNNMSYGRSDTIVLAVVEPENDKISLLSVPRDSYIQNKALGRKDKVNHTYNKGPRNTIESLENYFNIPIDYYASINFNGFVDLIDAIGGLEVNVEKNINFHDRVTKTKFSLSKGLQILDGRETLNYARYRGDGEGDFGRNRRQRQVISSLAKQSSDLQNIKKINQLMSILENNFKTNIKPLDIGVIIQQVDLGSELEIETIPLKAKPGRAKGASVVLIDEMERQRIIQILHDKLGFIEQD